MLTLRKMLDLPREERTRLLAKIPCSSVYMIPPMDELWQIRRIIHEHGGVWSETYHPQYAALRATYPDHVRKREADEALVVWLNAGVLAYFEQNYPDASEAEISEVMYTKDSLVGVCAVPVETYWVDWNAGRPDQRHVRVYEGPHGYEEESLDGPAFVTYTGDAIEEI